MDAIKQRCYLAHDFAPPMQMILDCQLESLSTGLLVSEFDDLDESDDYCLSSRKAECERYRIEMDGNETSDQMKDVVKLNVGTRVCFLALGLNSSRERWRLYWHSTLQDNFTQLRTAEI